MIIPTDGGLHPSDAKWRPMVEWLTANRFDVNSVPTDARIEIRDGNCLGVELFVRDAQGRLVFTPPAEPARRVEWHPLVQAPPPVLLPKETP